MIKEIYFDEKKYLKMILSISYRQMSWQIMKYLKTQPKLMNSNIYQEIYNHVRNVQIKYYQKKYTDYTSSELADFIDFISDLEIKNERETYVFDRNTIKLFRPGVKINLEKLFDKLLEFRFSPDNFLKTRKIG